MKRNEETEITIYALLNPAAINCITLKTFLLDFKPVDWSLEDAPGVHTHNTIYFFYGETLKIE